MEGKEKMSLRLWMPLMGDLRNQGLDNFSISTLGTISWVDGKLGAKALQAGNANQTINGVSINSNLTDILADEYSVSVWIKPLGNHVHYNGTILSSGDWNKMRWAFGVSQDNTKVDVLSRGHNTYLNCTVPVNEWTNLICTCDSSNRVRLYKNGEYIGYITLSGKPESDATNATIGRETYASGYFSFNGVIQDLRLYDHCLSEMEVKGLSKGLILHYPLNRRGFGQENLILHTHFNETGWWTGNSSKATISDGKVTISAAGEFYQKYGSLPTTNIPAGTQLTLSCYFYENTMSTGNRRIYYASSPSWKYVTVPSNYTGLFTSTFTTTEALTRITIDYDTRNMTGGKCVCGPCKLEMGAIATPWGPNSSDTLATTMGLNSTTEYDCSGFCNNGIRNKTFTWTSDTPKYAVSQNFNSNHLIEAEGLPAETSTIACWIKWHTLPSGYTIPIHDKQSGLAIGLTNKTRLISYVGTGNGGTGSCVNVSLETNTWYHIVVVKTGTNTRKVYINGEEITSMASNNYWGGDLNKFLVGGRHISGSYSNYIDGQICDVRAYATALSASDVKSLYQNCATIDPDGTIRGQIRS